MKIFLVTNSRKGKKIGKRLEEDYIVEWKEGNEPFKMTKNDYAILSDDINLSEYMEKGKKLILLVKEKEYSYIFSLAQKERVIDIIDINQEEEEIIQRIKRKIGKRKKAEE